MQIYAIWVGAVKYVGVGVRTSLPTLFFIIPQLGFALGVLTYCWKGAQSNYLDPHTEPGQWGNFKSFFSGGAES